MIKSIGCCTADLAGRGPATHGFFSHAADSRRGGRATPSRDKFGSVPTMKHHARSLP